MLPLHLKLGFFSFVTHAFSLQKAHIVLNKFCYREIVSFARVQELGHSPSLMLLVTRIHKMCWPKNELVSPIFTEIYLVSAISPQQSTEGRPVEAQLLVGVGRRVGLVEVPNAGLERTLSVLGELAQGVRRRTNGCWNDWSRGLAGHASHDGRTTDVLGQQRVVATRPLTAELNATYLSTSVFVSSGQSGSTTCFQRLLRYICCKYTH